LKFTYDPFDVGKMFSFIFSEKAQFVSDLVKVASMFEYALDFDICCVEEKRHYRP
jgi:hypothetical protein